MVDATKQNAIKLALLERFEKQRLPRILDIKKSVDAGNPLSEMDSMFLEELIRDARENKRYIDESPDDIKIIFTKVIQLYKDIIETALSIEKANSHDLS